MSRAHRTLTLIAASLLFAAFDGKASEITVGLHLASVHVPARDYHQNVNTGLYVTGDHFVAGFYRNSINRTTVYGAYLQPLGGGLDLIAGIASGYQIKCADECKGFSRGAITPMAGLSYRVPLEIVGMRPRLWFVPGTGKSSTVLHFSIERKF